MCASFYVTLIDPLLRDIRLFVPGFAGMKAGDRVLDVCCGTGDQVLHCAAGGIKAKAADALKRLKVFGPPECQPSIGGLGKSSGFGAIFPCQK